VRDGLRRIALSRSRSFWAIYEPMSDLPISDLAKRRFLKMNGLGNEITVLDLRGSTTRVAAAEARAIAADPRSHFDQLMVLHDPRTPGTDAYMRIYNTDGTESGACGNGTRCVAWAMSSDPAMQTATSDGLVLETAFGLLPVNRVSDVVFTVDMGEPRFGWNDIPLGRPFADTRVIAVAPVAGAPELKGPSAVSMGNPHAIFWVADAASYDLTRLGPIIENDPVFPERANISLAQILSADQILLHVWERGAGLTRACGSAACATLVAAARKGLAGRSATVTLPGGDLAIVWRETDGHVLMTGPVELEHEGVFSPDLFADLVG
jgi:diaminopimelate epimerase